MISTVFNFRSGAPMRKARLCQNPLRLHVDGENHVWETSCEASSARNPRQDTGACTLQTVYQSFLCSCSRICIAPASHSGTSGPGGCVGRVNSFFFLNKSASQKYTVFLFLVTCVAESVAVMMGAVAPAAFGNAAIIKLFLC